MCTGAALHDLILAAFAQAWRDGRLEMADHLLHALEALADDSDRDAHRARARAYRIVAQGRPS